MGFWTCSKYPLNGMVVNTHHRLGCPPSPSHSPWHYGHQRRGMPEWTVQAVGKVDTFNAEWPQLSPCNPQATYPRERWVTLRLVSLKPREGKWLIQGHTAKWWQSQTPAFSCGFLCSHGSLFNSINTCSYLPYLPHSLSDNFFGLGLLASLQPLMLDTTLFTFPSCCAYSIWIMYSVLHFRGVF